MLHQHDMCKNLAEIQLLSVNRLRFHSTKLHDQGTTSNWYINPNHLLLQYICYSLCSYEAFNPSHVSATFNLHRTRFLNLKSCSECAFAASHTLQYIVSPAIKRSTLGFLFLFFFNLELTEMISISSCLDSLQIHLALL